MLDLHQEIQNLSLLIAQAKREYSKLPELIEDEHDAISQSNLDRVEQIAKEKLLLGQEIEQKVFAAQRLALVLSERVSGSQGLKPLSDLISTLTAADWLKDQSAEVRRSIEVLENEVNEFITLREQITRPLNVNKLVLSKILAQRQENYAFWQSITADTFAPYNAKGVPSGQRQTYGFKAKA